MMDKKHYFNRRYLVIFFVTVFSVLIPVFAINFIYDPGDIYLQKMLKAKYMQDYVKLLTSSSTGVITFGNERAVKGALAQKAGDFDTVICGSSHVMPLGRVMVHQFAKSFPGRSLNLGVSGGALEDIMIFSHMILHNPHRPKALVIEISPWSLKWGMDVRYMVYQEHLYGMFKDLGIKPPGAVEPYWLQLLTNAVNFEYFSQSVKSLCSAPFKVIPDNPLKEYGEVGKFDFDKGYKSVVTLNDGSHVYSSSYIEQLNTKKDYIGNINYKLDGEDYDEAAVSVFEKMVDLVKKEKIEVYFLLAPYNPMFFKLADVSSVDRLTRVERRIRKISQENNIKVFGSYDPKANGLVEDDFFDVMHAKPAGLNKIDFSR